MLSFEYQNCEKDREWCREDVLNQTWLCIFPLVFPSCKFQRMEKQYSQVQHIYKLPKVENEGFIDLRVSHLEPLSNLTEIGNCIGSCPKFFLTRDDVMQNLRRVLKHQKQCFFSKILEKNSKFFRFGNLGNVRFGKKNQNISRNCRQIVKKWRGIRIASEKYQKFSPAAR